MSKKGSSALQILQSEEETLLVKERPQKLSRADRFVAWLDDYGDLLIHATFDKETAEMLIKRLTEYKEHNTRNAITLEEWRFLLQSVGLMLVFGKFYMEMGAMIVYLGFMSVYDSDRAVFSLSSWFPVIITAANIFVNKNLLEGAFRWTTHFSTRAALVSFISTIFHIIYMVLVIGMGWAFSTKISIIVCAPYSLVTCLIPAFWVAYELTTFDEHFKIEPEQKIKLIE